MAVFLINSEFFLSLYLLIHLYSALITKYWGDGKLLSSDATKISPPRYKVYHYASCSDKLRSSKGFFSFLHSHLQCDVLLETHVMCRRL
jgi:hypothetical protein